MAIVAAAVKIIDLRQNCKTICIPCHRHCDAFQILKEFGYTKGTDYIEVEQGFLDEKDRFYNRTEAVLEARHCGQICEQVPELYSEDLW